MSLRGADAGAGKDDVFHYPSSVVVGSDQAVAYDALCAPLVKRALAGYDCTLVAYGQTAAEDAHHVRPPGCLVEAGWTVARGMRNDDSPTRRGTGACFHAPCWS